MLSDIFSICLKSVSIKEDSQNFSEQTIFLVTISIAFETGILVKKSVQLQLTYTPLFSRTEQEKNPIGVTNERVISSSENNRIGVTKEGRKFIEKNYRRGYTEAICKTKFVNGLSPNS